MLVTCPLPPTSHQPPPRPRIHCLSDPVVKLTCGGVKASTKVVKKSLNPKYNETFKMPETPELELGDELVIVVEDWDLASG